MEIIENFKRGDTFFLTVTYKVDEIAFDVSDFNISSQIRSASGSLIDTMQVVKLQQTGKFTLSSSSSNTKNWPLGRIFCDIQFEQGGIVRSTESFAINVIEEVTK